ncbi:MAG TPA: hypothetical protein PLZ51_02160, partial [Aggregatilineales bacterium]|nr:hypothetical protein [Aggregatilineales bacterium]
MPDTTSLWVPMGESYTVNEIAIEGWQIAYGTGEFNLDSCQYRNGNTCYHEVVNYTTAPELYLLFVGKEWFNFDCPEEGCGECDYYDDCYDDCYECESNSSGLGAPVQGGGGFETPGPDNYISNLITVTSDLGSMTCDWVPSYYDIFYKITFGYLNCRVTSIA